MHHLILITVNADLLYTLIFPLEKTSELYFPRIKRAQKDLRELSTFVCLNSRRRPRLHMKNFLPLSTRTTVDRRGHM